LTTEFEVFRDQTTTALKEKDDLINEILNDQAKMYMQGETMQERMDAVDWDLVARSE
jgi:hypothetical protein